MSEREVSRNGFFKNFIEKDLLIDKLNGMLFLYELLSVYVII